MDLCSGPSNRPIIVPSTLTRNSQLSVLKQEEKLVPGKGTEVFFFVCNRFIASRVQQPDAPTPGAVTIHDINYNHLQTK